MIERDYATARKVLQSSSLTEMSYTNAGATPKAFFEACTLLAQGDIAGAQKSFETARAVFENAVKESPDSAERHANLGWFYAFMGRKTMRFAKAAAQLS